MADSDVKYLFEPRSFAVIGASADRSKIGHSVLKNLISGGYKGKIYPVNPHGGEILGLRAFADLDYINDTIDMASIVVPARFVPDAVKKCAEKGVRFVQIISSGFSETGNGEAEKNMARLARAAGTRILGPNIFGLYSSAVSMNSTFSATPITPGSMAILTQSGALGIAMIGKTALENIGLSAVVSMGNKCDLDESDVLEYLVEQDDTRVILMYIEGVKNGERLIGTLKKVTDKKPVVVIKSGRSKRGAMAAASHTGSLAGSDEIFDAIMRQCGVMRAESLEEAFNWCTFLSCSPIPRGDKSVIITNGGGIGVMATDACEKFGIELFDDQETLKKVFEPAVPSFGSAKNPVDITGAAGSEDYRRALYAPVDLDAMDAAVALYCETAAFDSENLAPMIREICGRYFSSGKPISFALVGGASVDKALVSLRRENLPVFGDVYHAVSSLGVSFRHKRRLMEKTDAVEERDIDTEKINAIIDVALEEGRSFLLANEGSAVMEACGIAIPAARIARDIDHAVRCSEELGFPLVMKVVSRDILHKSDAGGVAMDIDSKQEVIDAYEAILHNVRSYNQSAVIDGIEISEMVRPGTELIVGARIDPSFGPVVMCGLGGIYVEVMKDVVFRGLPLNAREVMAMLKEIKSFPLLLGVRGQKPRDINAVIESILRIGTVIRRCGRISDIEINPIVVYGQGRGLKAVDARILVSNPKEGK